MERPFFKRGCPTPTLIQGTCPPSAIPAAAQLGCKMPQPLTPLLRLPTPPPSSPQLPPGTATIDSSCNILIPSSLLHFSPEGALNPPAIVSEAHLWLRRMDPTSAVAQATTSGLDAGILSPGCCCWRSSPDTEGEPQVMLYSSCVHPSSCCRGCWRDLFHGGGKGGFRNAIFY